MTIKSLLRLPLLLMLVAIVSACATNNADEAMYDMNSWKTMIDDQCQAYFDGCNTCRREPGKQGLCTLKACAEYQKPRCLD